jgi:hypothetical protein
MTNKNTKWAVGASGYSEVADLLNGKSLITYGICKECGEFCDHIPTHIKYRHNMTVREYLLRHPQPEQPRHTAYFKPGVQTLLMLGGEMDLEDQVTYGHQMAPRNLRGTIR